MSTPVLSCHNLCKSYKTGIPVLDNFNISIEPGKIIGLLGPNGCGKSTLLKTVSGILTPDSGEIFICGERQSESTNRLISFLPERTYFNAGMKVEELIVFFAEFFPDFDEAVARCMFADLGIDTASPLRTLSKGTKEKAQLILVMSRKARLYLLDEPIGGVAPAARDYILKTIIGSLNPDATVLITTHLIKDIEPVLDEFAFMGFGGNIVLSGNADEAREFHGRTLDEMFKEVFRCSGNI